MFASAQHHLSGNQTVGMASHGDDKGLYVEFDTRAVLMPFKSTEAGRPIYEDTQFITIHFPGDKTKTVDRQVKLESDNAGPSDPERFPRQWQLFQNQLEQTGAGMPITEWPPLTKSQALELKGLKIYTVEALASLPDSACNWLGSRELRTKAQSWLEAAEGHSNEAALQAVIDTQNAQIEAMQAQIDDIVRRSAERAPDRDAAGDVPEAPAQRAKAKRVATTIE